MKLKSYKHIPLLEAKELYDKSNKEKLLVTTINWTYASRKGKSDHKKVHRNIYSTTIEKLESWILDCNGEVAESIINIEKEEK